MHGCCTAQLCIGQSKKRGGCLLRKFYGNAVSSLMSTYQNSEVSGFIISLLRKVHSDAWPLGIHIVSSRDF